MTTRQLFLGIDCGTQGTKAIILDAASGEVLGQGAAAHTMISGANGRREQDTQQWLEAFTTATRRALLAAKVDGQSILGIGVSGQQHGLVLLDDQGKVLRAAKLWCDTETTPENDRLLAHLGGEKASLERLGVVIAPATPCPNCYGPKSSIPRYFPASPASFCPTTTSTIGSPAAVAASTAMPRAPGISMCVRASGICNCCGTSTRADACKPPCRS